MANKIRLFEEFNKLAILPDPSIQYDRNASPRMQGVNQTIISSFAAGQLFFGCQFRLNPSAAKLHLLCGFTISAYYSAVPLYIHSFANDM